MHKNYSNVDFKSKKFNCSRKPILCHKELIELKKIINADMFISGPIFAMTAGSMSNKTISQKTINMYANSLEFQPITPRKVALLSKNLILQKSTL